MRVLALHRITSILNSATPGINIWRSDDLWEKKLPNTDEYSYALSNRKKGSLKDFSNWEELIIDFNFEKILSEGILLKQKAENDINTIINSSSLTVWNTYKVATCNSQLYRSEIGNKLMTRFPEADFSMVYFFKDVDTIISLRSLDNKVDVDMVARNWKGGGHKCASGLKIDGIHVCLPKI